MTTEHQDIRASRCLNHSRRLDIRTITTLQIHDGARRPLLGNAVSTHFLDEQRRVDDGSDAVVTGAPVAQGVPVDFVDDIPCAVCVAEAGRVDGAALVCGAGPGG